MMRLVYLIFSSLTILCFKFEISDAAVGPKHGKVVACYIASWSTYRPSIGSFEVENTDPTLCTHVIYSFVGLSETHDGIVSTDLWQDLKENSGKGGFERVVKLKARNPTLKVSLAIGGWIQGSKNFSKMARSSTKRERFVINTVEFLKEYHFDGLDFHWLYPTKRGGIPEDKHNFLLLILELREAFNKAHLLLTASLGVEKETIDDAYDVPGLALYLDYIHILSFNYHTPYNKKTGPNAPLRSSDSQNLEFTVNYLLQLGASPSKLVLGIPLYGHSFILENKTTNPVMGIPAESVGFIGQLSAEEGFLGYNEICLDLQNSTAKYKSYWDEDSETPFCVSGKKFISYDNEKSIYKKLKFAIQKNLAGVVATYIDNDDFRGECGTENFPLLRSINRDIAFISKNRNSSSCPVQFFLERGDRKKEAPTLQCAYELIN